MSKSVFSSKQRFCFSPMETMGKPIFQRHKRILIWHGKRWLACARPSICLPLLCVQPERPSVRCNTSYFSSMGKIAFFYVLAEETLLHTKYGMFSRTTGVSFCLMLEQWASSQTLHVIERAVTPWSVGCGTHVNILTLTTLFLQIRDRLQFTWRAMFH